MGKIDGNQFMQNSSVTVRDSIRQYVESNDIFAVQVSLPQGDAIDNRMAFLNAISSIPL